MSLFLIIQNYHYLILGENSAKNNYHKEICNRLEEKLTLGIYIIEHTKGQSVLSLTLQFCEKYLFSINLHYRIRITILLILSTKFIKT